jgi:hypothetical protein
MALFFPSCAETARRLSEAQDRPLSVGARFGVTIHLALCRFCRRYSRQLRFLRQTFVRFRRELGETSDARLSSQARQRIIEQLKRQ